MFVRLVTKQGAAVGVGEVRQVQVPDLEAELVLDRVALSANLIVAVNLRHASADTASIAPVRSVVSRTRTPPVASATSTQFPLVAL